MEHIQNGTVPKYFLPLVDVVKIYHGGGIPKAKILLHPVGKNVLFLRTFFNENLATVDFSVNLT